jgi:hypothetical protein
LTGISKQLDPKDENAEDYIKHAFQSKGKLHNGKSVLIELLNGKARVIVPEAA